MASEPRRETLIALQARRKAHRVATDVSLAHRSALESRNCVNCGAEFSVENDDATLCPHCRAWTEASPIASYSLRQVSRFRLPDLPLIRKSRVIDLVDAIGVLIAFLVIFAFILLGLWSIFADSVRALSR
jgi:hypothetical protein